MKLLGDSFDIHGGGLDLVFPHHENEVVQSESLTGQAFAKYWLHNGLLTKDGKKISKSDPGTIVLMSDLLERHDPDTLRALLLSSHYRRPIDYGTGRLDEIARGLQAFRNLFDRYERVSGRSFYDLPSTPTTPPQPGDPPVSAEVWELRERFLEAMDDDFNTGGALGELYEIVRVINRHLDSSQLEANRSDERARAGLEAAITVLRELTAILGLFRQPPQDKHGPGQDHQLTGDLMALLIELRATLRKEKNFALADRIRNRLLELGIALEDRPEGTTWKRA
jgi:cysteinyl-tRNA synthetase